MFTTNTEIWQKESKRRKLILKLLLLISFLGLLGVISIWALVTQPIFSASKSTNQISIDSARLKKHIQIISTDLFPRDESHLDNLNKVADYIKNEFNVAKGVVSEQPYEVNGKIYRNIVSQFGPDTKEIIVIGAHYDACGERPGADDNASGIAGLIELAYLLGKTNLKTRVEIVAYTLEEPPYFRTKFMGSAIHALSVKKRNLDVKLMFSLEMIGYFSDLPNSQSYPISFLELFYPNRGNFITIVGAMEQGSIVRKIKSAMIKTSELPVYSINAPTSIPGIDFSDQLNYWNEGFNAVMITDTAFYRNKNYHTMRDTLDKLDYDKMAMVIQGIYGAVLDLDN